MWSVSFENWVTTLRHSAERKGVALSSSDELYRKNYNRGETPSGTLSLIIEFGES